MHHQTLKLILMLLALTGPAAWGFAQQMVTIATTGQGTVTADKTEARQGELVTLTVTDGSTSTAAEATITIAVEDETDEAVISNVTLPGTDSQQTVSVVIPETVTDADGQEHTVTAIGSGALSGCRRAPLSSSADSRALQASR